MITFLTGENSFMVERRIGELIADFNGQPERVDGETLELHQLPDLLMGLALFSQQRLVIIRQPAASKTVWTALETMAPTMNTDIHLVLVEPKPDKRTKTYKALQKIATLQDFAPWSERDTSKAEQWVVAEAQAMGCGLSKKDVQTLVARVGADQWRLWQALQKLAVLEVISPEIITDIIEPNETESVFGLFEAGLKGEVARVQTMLATLAKTEDPYRLFGLLSGQAFQLLTLAVADKPTATVAADLGIHPFALQKLAPFAKRLGLGGARQAVAAFAKSDALLKTSAADPWLLIERALLALPKAAR